MRATTIVLQALCVLLGGLFVWSAFALTDHFLFGGALVGCLMFLMASLLGVDPINNPTASGTSRIVFKALSLSAVAPIVLFAGYLVVASVIEGRMSEALALAARLTLLVGVLLLLVFDNHPAVQRLLRRRGISAPDR